MAAGAAVSDAKKGGARGKWARVSRDPGRAVLIRRHRREAVEFDPTVCSSRPAKRARISPRGHRQQAEIEAQAQVAAWARGGAPASGWAAGRKLLWAA